MKLLKLKVLKKSSLRFCLYFLFQLDFVTIITPNSLQLYGNLIRQTLLKELLCFNFYYNIIYNIINQTF